jgi:hypothetical protein
MPENNDFFIEYKNEKVRVSTVLDEAKIYFSVHLHKSVTIAEGVVNDELSWYDIEDGPTPLAVELGEIIEALEI